MNFQTEPLCCRRRHGVNNLEAMLDFAKAHWALNCKTSCGNSQKRERCSSEMPRPSTSKPGLGRHHLNPKWNAQTSIRTHWSFARSRSKSSLARAWQSAGDLQDCKAVPISDSDGPFGEITMPPTGVWFRILAFWQLPDFRICLGCF